MEENIHRMLVLENLSFDRGGNQGLGALVTVRVAEVVEVELE